MSSNNRKSKKNSNNNSNNVSQNQLNQMLQSKMDELSNKNTIMTEEEISALKNRYTELQEFSKAVEASPFTREEKIKVQEQILQKLIDSTVDYEHQAYIQKKMTEDYKKETEILLNENSKNEQIKINMKNTCKEIEKNIQAVNQQTGLRGTEEDKKRNELEENFEKSLSEIKQKMQDQEKEGEDVKLQSVELQKELDEKIAQFEERQGVFTEKLQERDLDVKKKTDEFMDSIKQIEVDARKALSLREKIAVLGNNETEKKLKIALYEKKFIEYNDTLDKTSQMLVNFKKELIKVALKAKKSDEDNQKYKKNEINGQAHTMALFYKSKEVQNQIQTLNQDKSELKAKILEIQNKIKKLKQESEAQQTQN